ncbi:MAG: hypothetical protein HC924_13395 [Synechococcaceae cyanobacterium SM2_3_2]|nr:hypothetical protein [Synechococcaceae cyanobacterium SM2_3_2]
MNRIAQSQQKVYEKAVATKIIDLMDKLRLSSNENNKLRWIWELLQNAKDTQRINGKGVAVEVTFSPDEASLIFRHNGQCFTPENITFLIEQVSTKDRSSDNPHKTTGKFGTGFLTTHLLSPIVEIEGVVKDSELPYRMFHIKLDRSSTEIEGIIASLRESIEQLKGIEYVEDYTSYDESQYNTSFTYRLDSNGINTASIGIWHLEKNLPLNLVFVPAISEVSIQQSNEISIFSISETEGLTAETDSELELALYKVQEIREEEEVTHEYIILKKPNCQIAISAIRTGSQISLEDLSESDMPRLFCDFPLIGSEHIGIPFSINSSCFHPTEPRDGIFLTDVDNIKVNENKQIMIEAVSCYIDLIEYASSHEWGNLYHLAAISLPSQKDWLSVNWYQEEVLIPILQKLCVTPLVRRENGSKTALIYDDGWVDIPFSSKQEVRESIWDLVNGIGYFDLPAKSDIHHWYNIIRGKIWDRVKKEYSLKLTSSRLTEDIIRSCSDLDALTNEFDVDNAVTWLNQYYSFLEIAEDDLIKFLDDNKYKIIPNQYNAFCLPKDLYCDDDIEDSLKAIGKLLGKDYYEKLAHREAGINKYLTKKSQKSLVKEINELISSEDISGDLLSKACIELTSLFPRDESGGTEFQDLIYSISKKLYEDLQEKQFLSNWSQEIRSISDRIQTEIIVEKISEFRNLHTLCDHLSETPDEFCRWLSLFIEYLIELEWTDLLRGETPILANQNGTFTDLDDLAMEGEPIDESLKDIAASLRRDYRDELIDKSFYLPILEKRKIFQKDIGNGIRDIAASLLSELPRSKSTQDAFNQMILWMDENPSIAIEVFRDLAENRHKLYDDVEIANNLRKIPILEEKNHSLKTENEVLRIELERMKLEAAEEFSNSQNVVESPSEESLKIDDNFLITYGVTSQEKLQQILLDPIISRKYSFSNAGEFFSRLKYVLEIIERSKHRVREYLESLTDYDCSNWIEVGKTYIEGVTKMDRPISLIIRPSDSKKIIFYYPEEKQVLLEGNSELWTDNGKSTPRQITLGYVLDVLQIDHIDLPEDFETTNF